MGIIHEAWSTLASGSVQRIPDPRAKRAEMEAGPGFEGYIGLDSVDITPVDLLPVTYWGSLDDCHTEGFHGRLFAYCLTLRKTKTESPLILLSLDLGQWPSPAMSQRITDRIRHAFGLPLANLMVQTTGVFSSPDLDECRVEGGDIRLTAYLSFLDEALVKLVGKTLKSASWGVLEFAEGHCGLAIKSDVFIADSGEGEKGRWAVGANHNTWGDRMLVVGRIARTDGTSGTLVNYACWPATLAPWARWLSADFPGPARGIVERETGGPCMFLQGMAGDQCPAYALTRNELVVEKNGRELAYSVLSALAGMPPAGKRLIAVREVSSEATLLSTSLEDATLASGLDAKTIQCWVDLKDFSRFTAAEFIDAIDEGQNAGDVAAAIARLTDVTPAYKELETNGLTGWIWRAGGVYFVGVPADPYSAMQFKLRVEARPVPVVCLSGVNGSFGAMPPASLYREDRYSVRNTPFAAGTMERVTEVITDSLRS